MESDLQFTSKEPVFLHLAVETLCGGSEGEGRGQIGEKQKREETGCISDKEEDYRNSHIQSCIYNSAPIQDLTAAPSVYRAHQGVGAQ